MASSRFFTSTGQKLAVEFTRILFAGTLGVAVNNGKRSPKSNTTSFFAAQGEKIYSDKSITLVTSAHIKPVLK